MKRKHSKSFRVLLMLAVIFCQIKAHASESIAENASNSIAENATESKAESAVESAAESTVESTPEIDEKSIPEIAAENALENVTVPTASSELISVELPMIEERDPFNFVIDPLHILYNTFSNSGGDITVKEDTSLLFYNRNENGDTLSSRSDLLEIINKSTVPIEVTITAKIEKADGIVVVHDKDFTDRCSCDLYLAIVDNEGNEQPLSGDGEVSITIYLDQAPTDAYAYVLNEDTGEYQYVCQSEDMVFDTYSFGLIGACNEKGDWGSISGRLHGIISWNVEPVVSEESGTGGELDKMPDENPEDIAESSASAGDVPDEDGESSGGQAADGDENPTEDAADDKEGLTPENEKPDEKETIEESGSDADSDSDGDEADGGTAPDKDGQNENSRNEDDQNEGEQTADGNGDSTEDVASVGDSDVEVQDSGVETEDSEKNPWAADATDNSGAYEEEEP